MQTSTTAARDSYFAARWLSLAEQRLAHLIDLFESGRFRRYHTDDGISAAIRDTTSAIEVWRRLVPQDTAVAMPESIVAILPPSPFAGAASAGRHAIGMEAAAS